MIPQLIVLYHGELSPADIHFGRLSELVGVGGAFVEASRLPEIERSADHSLCIVASADTIASLSAQPGTIQQLYRKATFLFFHGFRDQESHNRVARLLTEEQVSGVVDFSQRNLEYCVSSSEPEITREFCGLSFGPVHTESDRAFAVPVSTARIRPLICIDKMPFWMMLQKEQCTLFLLACREIADVNQRIEGKLSAGEYFSRLMPSAMFIRFVYKEAAWHVPQRFANLIIDDPLLTDSYGFLNYRRFVELMEQRDCCATIAFIPWNYKRTQRAVAKLFRRYPNRLSLCVHGCDHSQAEFSEADLGKLNAKIQLASQRMKMHEALTGVPCSEVMVFPQGCFSRESLRALKANNYLAAVNSGALPADTQTERTNSQEQLTIADHLTPAITKYGYPLFLRRYPGKIEDFAFDLFFGKPALVVEHHSCFKDDGTGLMDLVGKLNGLNCGLIWAGVGEIIENIYLEKQETVEFVECRIMTNDQIIRNYGWKDKSFAVTKYEDGNVPVDHVLVNGRKVRFTVEGDRLRLVLDIPGKQSARIRIVYRNVLPEVQGGERFAAKSVVWGRRLLSELRDNVLSKNDLLLGAAYAAKRAIVKGLQRG